MKGTKLMSELTKRSMLVKVSVHRHHFKERDVKSTKELSEKYNIDQSMLDINKTTMYREFTKSLDKCLNKVLPTLYRYTLPWRDGGWRILDTSMFSEFESQMRELNEDINESLELFITNYNDYISLSALKLGELCIDHEKYPTPNELRRKYRVNISYEPLVTAGDFRIELSDSTVSQIKEDYEKRYMEKTGAAMREAWERVISSLERMYERFSAEEYFDSEEGKNKKPKLFKSVLTNVQDLTKLLTAFNITNDPKLEEVRKDIENKFYHLTIEDIKEDEAVRRSVAQEAEEILNNIRDII